MYLLELRPEENVWDGFILDADQILPTARETWEGVKVVVNSVLKRLNIDPISDDPNAEGTITDSEPKQSPPFSSHRHAASRFEHRARSKHPRKFLASSSHKSNQNIIEVPLLCLLLVSFSSIFGS